MRYEVTVDDPGAYTAPWTHVQPALGERHRALRILCQQANYAGELMVGDETSVDRTSQIVP